MSELISQVQQLAADGKSTGEIALALGWERNPASRRKIRAMLEGREAVIHPKSKGKKHPEWWQKNYLGNRSRLATDERVQRSTGHRQYERREQEASWIMGQFIENDVKFKGKTAEFLAGLRWDNITPDDLFRLRDIMGRKRKIMG